MPYVYRSEQLTEAARRGRRVMMMHPEWREASRRNRIPWDVLARDMVADILHGLHSRAELAEIQYVLSGHTLTGGAAQLARSLATFEGDFEDEREELAEY